MQFDLRMHRTRIVAVWLTRFVVELILVIHETGIVERVVLTHHGIGDMAGTAREARRGWSHVSNQNESGHAKGSESDHSGKCDGQGKG